MSGVLQIQQKPIVKVTPTEGRKLVVKGSSNGIAPVRLNGRRLPAFVVLTQKATVLKVAISVPEKRKVVIKISKGEKGEKGETGAQGLQGIQGLKGDKGEKGDPGTGDMEMRIYDPNRDGYIDFDGGYF